MNAIKFGLFAKPGRRLAALAPAPALAPALAAALLAGTLLAGTLLAGTPASAETPKHEIVVIDGDTVEVDGQVLGLYGIDAPELGQTCLDKSKRWRCGLQAAVELRTLLAFWGNATCLTVRAGDDALRAICHDPKYNDAAEVLLARGLAIALPTSVPAYKRAQIQAKTAKLGIWRGKFVEPAAWREGQRLARSAEEATDGPAEVCDVKGTITEKGARVYYVPTDKNYETITLSQTRGERMFCSDDEAELAGWKRYPR